MSGASLWRGVFTHPRGVVAVTAIGSMAWRLKCRSRVMRLLDGVGVHAITHFAVTAG